MLEDDVIISRHNVRVLIVIFAVSRMIVAEEGEWRFVPYNVNILEKNIVSK